MLPSLVHADIPSPSPEKETYLVAASSKTTATEDTYQINFNNIAMTEYIRFVAKISGSNFVFDQADLQFSVTIVSEEPANIENIFSALAQVLRINNLTLLEQDGNYVISKSNQVFQIPEVISSDDLESSGTKVPLVTRVFRIRNTNVNSVATIIRSMVSQKALVSVSNETNQLIVTDVTTNVDKIATLLSIIDSPHSPLEIESYTAKNVSTKDLVTLAQQLVNPFTEGNSLIFVPQLETNTIFIVSTPSLIERAMMVLQDLDTPAQANQLGASSSENIFLYKITNRSEKEILSATDRLVQQLKGSRNPPTTLIAMLGTARYVPDSNSLLFIGDATTFSKVQEILGTIDAAPDLAHKTTFLLYPIRNVPATQLMVAIKDFAKKLKSGSAADPKFISSLESVSYLSENNALVFSGLPDVLSKVQSSLSTLDVVPDNTGSQFLIYKLANDNLSQIQNSLNDLVVDLRKSPTPDVPLIDAISTLKYIPDSHSILFTSDRTTLDRLQKIIASFDQSDAGSRTSFYIYQPKSASQRQLEAALTQFVGSLKNTQVPDGSLISAIESAKFLPETQSFVFSGSQESLKRLEQMLPALDAAVLKKEQGSLFVYQIKNLQASAFQDALKALAGKLAKAGDADPDLLNAIKNAEYVRETNSMMFTGSPAALERLQVQLLPTIDVSSSASQAEQGSFFMYQLKAVSDAQFEQSVDNLLSRLKAAPQPDNELITVLESAHYMKETNSILFTGTQGALARLQNLIPSLDTVNSARPQSSVYIYSPQKATYTDFEHALSNFISNLKQAANPDTQLIQALESGQYLKDTHSFTFTGSQESLSRVQQILPSLDVPSQSPTSAYYVYRIKQAKMQNLQQSLETFVKKLKASPQPDQQLINAIHSMQPITESNSLVFTGDQGALDRLAKLMPEFDVPWGSTAPAGLPASDQFFIYTPHYRKGSDLMKALQEMISNLKGSGLADPALLHTLETAKWVESSGSLVFSGDATAINSVKTLMPTVDAPPGADTSQQIFLYRPVNMSYQELEKSLHNLTATLNKNNPSDAELQSAISTMQWDQTSQSLAFKAPLATVDRLKTLLASLDVPTHSTVQQVYFIYKLQYASIENAISYLKKIGSNLGSAPSHRGIVEVISNIKPVPENNAILLTGPSDAVDQVKQLLGQYDTPSAAMPSAGTVFIYKPKYMSPQDLQSSLETLVIDLSKATQLDSQLQKAIQSAKIVPANQSLAFSGPPNVIDQIKSLISEIDTADSAKRIHHVGAMTFFIYKLQYASAQQFMSAVKAVTVDLAKGGVEDKDLAATINSMKYIKETNSILFTGSDATLQKVQGLIPKFDVPSLAAPQQPVEGPPTTYVIYRPQYKSGTTLIQMLCDFLQNLHASGVSNLGLTNTINSLNWMESTCSLIITGDQESIAKVQDLLKQFDMPDAQQASLSSADQLGETSFLIYKLQYHQGDDIRIALTRIAGDLQDANKGQKMPIIDALNAVQWISGTNSLLTSGPPDILARVRELIQNLDVPLRQVFIEVLILQTDLTNNQSIGLSWSGNAQYKNQFVGQTGNFGGGPGNDPVATVINPLNATTTPNIPANAFTPQQGFNLGAIGDIILHKGKTFFTLGSFVTAIQQDFDSVILTNPKFIAQDSNNATIFFGQNIPFAGSAITIQGAGSSTSTSLEYRNVGNNISITPTLGSGDLITLDINTNLSSTAANTTINNQLTGITTNQTSLVTRVQVPDSHFICLTGQLSDTTTHQRNQIPCLGGLPLVGLAFQNNTRTKSKDNIIIFVRPQIVKTFDQYKQITQNQEDLFKDAAGLPVMAEEMDEGLDWVKTPENE